MRSTTRPRSRARGSGGAAPTCRATTRSRRPSSRTGRSAAPTAARGACRDAAGTSSRTSFHVCWIESLETTALLRQLGLRGETVAEAAERRDQGVDLEERVLLELGRAERELEVDRVDAVGDLQH